MLDGHEFYGFFPGGASGGILPARLGDVPLDFDTLQDHGCFIGSAAVIIFSKHDSAKDLAINAMRFFEHESLHCNQFPQMDLKESHCPLPLFPVNIKYLAFLI